MRADSELLGHVLFVQVQREPLKIGPTGSRIYNPASIERVAALLLTERGVVGLHADGSRILDAHHADHPHTRFRGDNGISVGFTGHYDRMRDRFGAHLTDGIAGENMIVESAAAPSVEDLDGMLVFENPDGTQACFHSVRSIAPCVEFSHFAHQAQSHLPGTIMKATLQFLDHGTRGFALALAEPDECRVLPGARLVLRA